MGVCAAGMPGLEHLEVTAAPAVANRTEASSRSVNLRERGYRHLPV